MADTAAGFQADDVGSLQPANAAMEPRIVDADRCKVQGVVIGVLRSYN